MERIWFSDIRGFMTETNYARFWPSKEMTFVEQMNALLRFSIYFSVILFVIRKDPHVFFIIIFIAVFTWMLYTVDVQNKQKEKFYLRDNNLAKEKHTNKLCVKPTKNNPFMNVLVSDYSENPTRKPACDVTKAQGKKLAKKHFDSDLYRDTSDIYNKIASDRNYYTTPVTTIPNDQQGFAEFLYKTGPTCKEGSGTKCHANLYRPMIN